VAKAFEATLGQNGWPSPWRDGIYDFHRYDSTARGARYRDGLSDADTWRARWAHTIKQDDRFRGVSIG
jgi:hypothetical protein